MTSRAPRSSRTGPGGRDRPTERLFVCAWPPAAVRDELATISMPKGRGVRWVAPANWHVTLRFLGDVRVDDVVEALRDAVLPGASAMLGPAIDTFDGRQIVIPVSGVDPLAIAVRATTSTLGDHDPRPFRGHLTLGRVGRGATPPMLGRRCSASFDIGSVDLVSSETLADGPVYTTVASFACTLTA